MVNFILSSNTIYSELLKWLYFIHHFSIPTIYLVHLEIIGATSDGIHVYISQTIAKQDDNTKCLLLRLTSFTVDLRLPRLKNSIDESGDSEIKLHCLIFAARFHLQCGIVCSIFWQFSWSARLCQKWVAVITQHVRHCISCQWCAVSGCHHERQAWFKVKRNIHL